MRDEELEVEGADTGKSAILEWKRRSGVDYGKETSTLFTITVLLHIHKISKVNLSLTVFS